MTYYEVLVTQDYTAATSVFTYASEEPLELYEYVVVPLQRKKVPGLVIREVAKPSFVTKRITVRLGVVMPFTQRKFVKWLSSYYLANEAQVLQLCAPGYLAKLTTRTKKVSDKIVDTSTTVSAQLPLTEEQEKALKTLTQAGADTVLLHGETGTGKTRVYSERIHVYLAQNRSVLVLVPEIGLVEQIYKTLKKYFGESVLTYHSQLSDAKRRSVWLRAAQHEACIVVGTRSSLFLPFSSLGCIVVDEAHEPAYKQEEGVRYHAVRAASALARFCDAQLILGSATPSVEHYAMAQERHKAVIRMQTPAAGISPVDIKLIDMRERVYFNEHNMLSKPLLQAIEKAISSGQQSLIYLNRRGTARLIMCQGCGWQALCPRCNIALTYHHDSHTLKCHVCAQQGPVPTFCPECDHTDIMFKSAGTKAIALWLEHRFPQARIARFDTDNLTHESLRMRHTEVSQGDIDILVGTQMLVKGLDLKHLSVVGILSADLSLQIPDFSAEERTYQLIRQAIGRVGRGHTDGSVILQSFNPDNKVIQHAVQQNYDDFYTSQIAQRKAFQFPPFCYIALFWISAKHTKKLQQEAQACVLHLRKIAPEAILYGPTESIRPKKVGSTTMQIVVKSSSRIVLLTLAKSLPQGWMYDLEPISLL